MIIRLVVWSQCYYFGSLTSLALDLSVQLKDKKNEHAITGSLLQALDKHHSTENEEVSALNTRVVWNLTILLETTHLVLSSP